MARHFGYIPQGGDVPNLKPTLIHLLGQNQFGGALNEDPHAHLAVFEEHCGTFANEGDELDTLKLKCFHLSLRDNARTWLRTVNRNNTQTWADMEKLFLGKYFPPSKTQHFRAKITTFKQAEGESLTEAWDRWAELQRLCPNHGLDMWLLFQFFYGGCTIATKTHLNSAAGGNMSRLDPEQAMSMIEDMAVNQREWTAERGGRANPTPGVLKVDEVTALQAKIEAMQHQITKMQQVKSVAKTSQCGICGNSDHSTAECQAPLEGEEQVEQVNSMFYNQGDKRNDPVYNKGRQGENYNTNNYNSVPRYNSNQYQNSGNQYQNRTDQNQYQGPSQITKFEKMIEGLVYSQTEFMNNQRATNTEFSDSLRNLNNKIQFLTTQIAQQAASSSRPQGTLPGKPDINPREHANAVH